MTYFCFRYNFFVQRDKTVDGTISSLQVRKMWNKIVANEKAHENPIVDGSLEIERKRSIGNAQISIEVFTQDIQLHENELCFGTSRMVFIFSASAVFRLMIYKKKQELI